MIVQGLDSTCSLPANFAVLVSIQPITCSRDRHLCLFYLHIRISELNATNFLLRVVVENKRDARVLTYASLLMNMIDLNETEVNALAHGFAPDAGFAPMLVLPGCATVVLFDC